MKGEKSLEVDSENTLSQNLRDNYIQFTLDSAAEFNILF